MPVIIIILLAFQLILLLLVSINIYPELFFFPWLVAKNWLPYRDFFDHHGFLLYYLLAPLSLDKTLFSIKVFYIFIQLANLLLFILIIKKNISKVGLVICSLIFILLNFFTNENNFWYETVIAFFYLSTYFVLTNRGKPNFLLAGFFITLSSFIKPTSILLLFPLLLIYRRAAMLISVVLGWLLVLLYFYSQNGLSFFYQYLFIFNSKLPGYVINSYKWQDTKFLVIAGIMLFLSLFFLKKELFKQKSLALLSFIAVSLVFVYPVYGKAHLTVFTVFLPIAFAQVIKKYRHFIYNLFLAIYLFYLVLLNFRHIKFLQNARQPYAESNNSAKIVNLVKHNYPNRLFFVLGNKVELYYYLDQLPPTRFPLYFKNWTGKYYSDFQAQTISGLKQHQIKIVAEPKPIDSNYADLKLLRQYLKNNYQLTKYSSFNIYRFKTR